MELVILIVAPPAIAILWHETAHALFALAVTRGTVTLRVGFGPSVRIGLGRLRLRVAPILVGGICTHEGANRRGDRALIAAAGPVSSAFLAVLALGLSADLVSHHAAALLAQSVATASALCAAFTAIPMRYSAQAESDGMAVLRALHRPATSRPRWLQVERRPGRPLRLLLTILLAVVIPVAFMASVWLGLWVVVAFGLVFRGERR